MIIVCSILVVSLKTVRCLKYVGWVNTLCAGMEENFVCETRQGKKTLSFFNFILCICKFLYFATINCALC